MTREWLKKIREEKGLTQGEVAKQSEIVQQSYQRIESGVTDPDVKNAKKIAAVLGFPWPRFYEDEEEAAAR